MKKSTSVRRVDASVENISTRGIWVVALGREYFLDFKSFPWFRDATIRDIHNVKLVRKTYLRWPALDIDLELECLDQPERYPLIYRD